MRFVGPLVALVCGAALLSACGGGEEASPAPSAQELYCDQFRPYVEAGRGGEESEAEAVARMKAFADAVADLERPDDMTPDAVKGLDMWVERVQALPKDAGQLEVMEALNAETTQVEQDRMAAFIAYGNSACLQSS